MAHTVSLIAPALACLLSGGPAFAQESALAQESEEASLSDYFGFSSHDVIKIGDDPGPMLAADLNGDGLEDLLIVNNHDSRIDVLYQKKKACRNDIEPPSRVNELPDHWRYRRESIPLADHARAFRTIDLDGDGDLDILYAGRDRVVVLEQDAPEEFTRGRIHTVNSLEATQGAFILSNILGSSDTDLLSIVDGKIMAWPLDGDDLGTPVTLSAGQAIRGIVPADYNGDGLMDIAGIVPDDSAPVRIWFGQEHDGQRELGAQVIFEMPPIIVFEAVQLPGEAAARIGVIERASKRIVLYRLSSNHVENSGNRDASFVVHSFDDPGNRDRTQVVADINGDGLEDLVATDTKSNSLVVYRQSKGQGLQASDSFPTLSKVGYVAASDVDGDGSAEIFVLSEDEGVVGRSMINDGKVEFPRPMAISEGHTPVAMNLVNLEQGPRLAVIANEKREYLVDLISMDGSRETIELGAMSRAPDTVMAVDADQDSHMDLLLFTREKPMIMLQSRLDEENGSSSFQKMEKDDMGQFGLVAKAASDNTTVFDLDGDGKQELLIADSNHVRAVRYESEPEDGSSPGWQVVSQVNTKDPNSKLVSLATLDRRIIAADDENNRLVVFEADENGDWSETESLTVRGFPLGPIKAGTFTGDQEESILSFGNDGFAVIRLGGLRQELEEIDSWRTDEERRLHYDLHVGDINSDGYGDMIALDSGEQMMELFTFDHEGTMHHVTNFKIFESRLFGRGDGREYQPSQAILTDLTGDGAHDIVMLIHDRILIYEQ